MLSAAVPSSFPEGGGSGAWELWLSVAAFLVLVLQVPAVLILLTWLLQGPVVVRPSVLRG